MRTKQDSVNSLLAGVEQARAASKYDIVRDLALLYAQYTKISKRDYLALLRALQEKYGAELDRDITAALQRRCLAGDTEAIRLYDERKRAASGGAREVRIVDDIT